MNFSRVIIALVLLIVIFTGTILWDTAIKRPSVLREWQVETRVLPEVQLSSGQAIVKNVRNFQYNDDGSQVVQYYDAAYKLEDLDSMWFVVEPFASWDAVAHTYFSFGFTDGTYVSLSVEARREVGETYSAWRGIFNEYEIVYLLGDERDFFVRRAVALGHELHLYKLNVSNEFLQLLFVDMLRYADRLGERAEFYNTFSSTCTTRLRWHANRVQPESVPWTPAAHFPGYADVTLYDLGYVATTVEKKNLRETHAITEQVRMYKDDPAFSQKIREHLPVT